MTNDTDHTYVTWRAPAHESRKHSADWYWAVAIITVALVVAFVILGNILLAIIIAIGMGTLLLTANHEQKLIEYAIEHEGFRSGNTLYPWETLDSFWVLNATKERSAKLLIISKRPFMPHIVVLLSQDVSPKEVRDVLSHALPEVRQIEPLPDRIMRKIGF